MSDSYSQKKKILESEHRMKNTVLCYIEKEDSYLLLYRNRKKNDPNAGKYIGVGGKFEENETPDECLLREVREETGYTLTSYRFRGIVTFVSDCYETEQMFLYTADGFVGEPITCDEGELRWVKKDEIPHLPQWEGDRLFLDCLRRGEGPFVMKLVYQGDTLVSSDHRPM